MGKSKRPIAGALGWAAIDSWVSASFAIVVAVVLARLLEPRAFGLVAMAGVYIAFVRVFVEPGPRSALVQRKEIERAHLDTAFWMAVIASFALVVITVLAAPLVAAVFSEPQLTPIERWLSLGLLFSAPNGTQRAILQRYLASSKDSGVHAGVLPARILESARSAANCRRHYADRRQRGTDEFGVTGHAEGGTGYLPAQVLDMDRICSEHSRG